MAHGFLLILLFSHIISTNAHACNQTECASLLSFASTLSSRPLNWTLVNCCRWKGITCNKDGLVTHLLLSSKGLKGAILPSSSSLGNLTHLTHLNLSHNSLSGQLGTEFFLSLNRLEILDLSFNLLFGKLPFSLPSHNIQTLDLSSNRFHGAIPSSFFRQAQNLTSFNVHNNSFSGLIPSSICLHSSPLIRLLDFSLNAFNGNISPGLGECSKLHIFRAGNNNLSGLLPKDIYNATKLEEIAFPSNSLHGAISEKISNLNGPANSYKYCGENEIDMRYSKIQDEHFGIVPLEAMAAHKPVIAVKNGETGFLCDCNPREFSLAMAKLITDPQMAQRMGIEARRHVTESFSTKIFGQNLNQCIVDVAWTKRD